MVAVVKMTSRDSINWQHEARTILYLLMHQKCKATILLLVCGIMPQRKETCTRTCFLVKLPSSTDKATKILPTPAYSVAPGSEARLLSTHFE